MMMFITIFYFCDDDFYYHQNLPQKGREEKFFSFSSLSRALRGRGAMVKSKPLAEGDASSTKHIANRMKRQEVYQRIKKGKKEIKKAKKEQRKRDAEDPEKKDTPKQVPKTLDNMREEDETILLSDDEEVRNDEDEDEFARYFDGETPKTVITTCNHPSKTMIQFVRALLELMPGSYYYERRNFDIKDIAKWCGERGFTNLVVLGQGRTLGGHKHNPCELLLIHLPEGPSLHFKLSNVQLSDQIKVGGVKAGRATKHKPELILNGFSTRLGLRVSRAFTALFPQVSQHPPHAHTKSSVGVMRCAPATSREDTLFIQSC